MNKQALNPRQQKILDLVRENREVQVNDLAERFQVTPMTVRRDLETMEQLNLVKRTHGGAVLLRPAVIEFAFSDKQKTNLELKQAVARSAAELVEPGMTVVLDTGTSTLELARACAGKSDIRVLTSSLAIASTLYAYDNIDLVLLGGSCRKNSPDLSGPLTEDNLQQFHTQIAFIGADAADTSGLYTTDMSIARVSQAMITGADRVVALLDSTKFTQSAFVRFADWNQIDVLVTDERVGRATREWLDDVVPKVITGKIG